LAARREINHLRNAWIGRDSIVFMWQFFELGALVTSATQDVVDKFAIVRSESIDTFVASFHRTAFFLAATVAIGLLGPLGGLRLFFHWEVLLFAPLCVLSSLLWTYLLRNIEVMTIGAVFYLAPLLYLFIDTHLLGMHFSAKEIAGIALLVGGGVAFSIDGDSLRPKPELTRAVWGALMLVLFYNGAEAYLFKYLHATYDLNGVSFYASLWLLSTACLFALVLSQRKERLLIDKTARTYLPRVAVSKSCDAASSVLNAQALSLAAVSQVTAFDALYPLISFVLVLIVQEYFKMSLNEDLHRRRLPWKAFAVALLVAGSFLVA
jgi:drug/metabolite transporter (DMT)-like permease